MARIFNPPPTWPAPPQGWQPPPGWEPDPQWPPPPPGWQLWQRPNRHPFRRAFAVTSVLFVAAVLLVFATAESQPANAGEVVGRLLSLVLLLPGLAVGTIAFFSKRRWGWGRYALALIVAESLSLLLAVAANSPTSST